jgi:hypothetical protein
MPIQKKTIKVLMFLLPAIVTLFAYATFHELLFKKPPCLINCGQPGSFSENEKYKKWLAFLESLKSNPLNTQSTSKRPRPTPLDIAFLQEKMHTASNDNDFLSRYNQRISDLTNPSLITTSDKVSVDADALSEKVAPLAYMPLDDNPNNQAFISTADDERSNASPLASRNNPLYIVPSAGVPFIAGGGSPAGSGGGSNNGGSSSGGDTGNPPSGNPSPGQGSDNGGTPGQINPITTIPVPKSIYLLLGLLVSFALVRLKLAQGNIVHRYEY